MRNTPILIPIILVICLGTLTYLLVAALSTTTPGAIGVQPAGADAVAQTRITDAPPPRAASGETPEPERKAPVTDADLDRYYQGLPNKNLTTERDGTREESELRYGADEDIELSEIDNEVSREVLADRNGAYVVLAGSFRQLLNAETQVSKMKKAGFAESQVQKSTGGAYAMAVAGRRSSQAEADELMARLRRKGFEARCGQAVSTESWVSGRVATRYSRAHLLTLPKPTFPLPGCGHC